MSRSKSSGSRSNPADQEMHQIWHGVVDTIRLLPSMSSVARPYSEEVRAIAVDEQAKLDEAVEKLSILIALRRGEPGSAASQRDPIAIGTPTTAGPTTPSASLLAPGGKRKRRPSYSASPAPGAGGSSTSISHIPIAPHTGGSADSALTSIASPLPNARQGTPSGREMTGKQRKEQYHDQLPLQPGRKVVFKEPGSDGGEETWILAVVKKCIGQDKNRYEINDIDESVKKPFIATLRSIIPLPDLDAPPHVSYHPSKLENFPKGTKVLALYPDTTSFYQATVISAPSPGTGMGPASSKKGGAELEDGALPNKYRLSFEDDQDQIQVVHKGFVIARP